MSTTIIGVDLATKAIQVWVYLNSKVLSNKELTPQQFSEFLRQQTPCVVVFESCSGFNYWAQYSLSVGHFSKFILGDPRKTAPRTSIQNRNRNSRENLRTRF